MSTTTQAVVSTPTPGFAKRKARALIGWLPEQEGATWISGRQMSQVPDPAHIALCQRARAFVSSRPNGVDQTNLFQSLPSDVEGYIAELRANEKSAQILAESGDPRVVDLRKLCAAQKIIYTDDAVNRVQGLIATDLVGIARVTLPLPSMEQLPVAFDETKNSWLMSSPNPNLRVVGHFSQPAGPGLVAYGFVVAMQKSYLQVAGIEGRYFLRDGYHRAYGLLAAGITHAPALVKEFSAFEEAAMPSGLFPPTVYLGSKPPLLIDYLDNDVAIDTFLPVTTKLIAIQALELNSIG